MMAAPGASPLLTLISNIPLNFSDYDEKHVRSLVLGNLIVVCILVIGYWNYQLVLHTIWPLLWALLASMALYPLKQRITTHFEQYDHSLIYLPFHILGLLARTLSREYSRLVGPSFMLVLVPVSHCTFVGYGIAQFISMLLGLHDFFQAQTVRKELPIKEEPDVFNDEAASQVVAASVASETLPQSPQTPPKTPKPSAALSDVAATPASSAGAYTPMAFYWKWCIGGYLLRILYGIVTTAPRISAIAIVLHVLITTARFLWMFQRIQDALYGVATLLVRHIGYPVLWAWSCADSTLLHIPGKMASLMLLLWQGLVYILFRPFEKLQSGMRQHIHILVAVSLVVSLVTTASAATYFTTTTITAEWRHAIYEVRSMNYTQLPGYGHVNHYFTGVDWQDFATVVESNWDALDKAMQNQTGVFRYVWTFAHTFHRLYVPAVDGANKHPAEHVKEENVSLDEFLPSEGEVSPATSKSCDSAGQGSFAFLNYMSVDCMRETVTQYVDLEWARKTFSLQADTTATNHNVMGAIKGAAAFFGLEAYVQGLTLDPSIMEGELLVAVEQFASFAIAVLASAASLFVGFFSTMLSLSLFLHVLLELLRPDKFWLSNLLMSSAADANNDGAKPLRTPTSTDTPSSNPARTALNKFAQLVEETFRVYMKLGLYNAMVTWLMFSWAGVNFTYTAVSLATFTAIVPLFPTFLLAIPATLELLFHSLSLGFPLSYYPLCFFAVYAFLTLSASFGIFAEIEMPSSFISLAVIAGMSAFGFHGAIVGPVLVELLYVAYCAVAESPKPTMPVEVPIHTVKQTASFSRMRNTPGTFILSRHKPRRLVMTTEKPENVIVEQSDEGTPVDMRQM